MCSNGERFKECIKFQEIRDSLTGYGRFTHFNYEVITLGKGEVWTNASSDQKYAEYHKLISVQEG